MRGAIWGALVVLALAIGALGVAAATVDDWFLQALDPGPFDPTATPPPPDFGNPEAWAAWPGVPSGADAEIPGLPKADPDKAPGAVFYLHPTTHVGTAWNAPVDDSMIARATERGGTLIQASVFNACCAVYAPRYRQAHGIAFTHPTEDGARARDVAFADVSEAFSVFLEHVGKKPFFVAGHSQGSKLAARLLRERVAGTELEERFLAAYIPGADVRPDDTGLPVCETRAQRGCVAAWNARGPNHHPSGLEYDADNPDTLRGRICVNPISWRADGEAIAAHYQQGAVFFDTSEPRVLESFADAQCVDGVLVVTELGDLERDLASRALLWIMGPENYHPVEYQLYYNDIRYNATRRMLVWLDAHGVPEPAPPEPGPE